MPTDAADSRGDWALKVPFEAQLGFALVFLAYGVAGFIDIIEYQPSAVLWLAASAGLFGYAVHRTRFPREGHSRTTPTDTADSEGSSSLLVPFEAQLGVALVFLVYGVAALADLIAYRIPGRLWIAAGAGLFGYAVHQVRQPLRFVRPPRTPSGV